MSSQWTASHQSAQSSSSCQTIASCRKAATSSGQNRAFRAFVHPCILAQRHGAWLPSRLGDTAASSPGVSPRIYPPPPSKKSTTMLSSPERGASNTPAPPVHPSRSEHANRHLVLALKLAALVPLVQKAEPALNNRASDAVAWLLGSWHRKDKIAA
ncbi:hypothetical protein GQ54DRAFT_299141 [Martensiomyces pterosporus]|nr:hypothetical protein GQ54DRAFT_299141 [Martensiomyces pterosporus]